MSIKQIVKKLESFDKVKTTLVLDAGKCVVLVLTTKFSIYEPDKGFTELTRDEAEALSRRYWHHENFTALCTKYA